MIEQAFEVAAEFKFDVGQALINTKALQQGVDELSNSAGQAMGALNYLASGLVARLGLGSGGLLTILTAATQEAERFDIASLGIANNITENFKTLTGTIDTFNDRLNTSHMIMGRIQETATSVGLPANELGALTTKLATPLANRGKLGTNYQGGIDLAKNLMMAAQNTGINTTMASESLYRALSDKMPLHGALFARLANTGTFKDAGIKTQGQLQNMNQDKKIDILSRALETLANDADALAHRLGTMHAQFIIMKDRVMMILQPIGEGIQKAITKVMTGINGYLKAHGKEIGDSIGKFIGDIFEDPKGMLINLMQLKEFGKDFKKSLHLVELYGTFRFIKMILTYLGVTFNGGLVMRGLTMFWEGLVALAGMIPWGALFSGAMTLLGIALTEVLPILIGALILFQALSRAKALAKVEDAEVLATAMPKLVGLWVRLKDAFANIMLPITMLIDGLAQVFKYLFTWGFWINFLMPVLSSAVSLFEDLGNAVVYTMAFISALTNMLIGLAFEPWNAKNLKKNFGDGWDQFLKDHPLGGDGKGTPTSNVVNNNHIEARFDMREQMEPDRIAFAVTEHLKGLALNPMQGRGRSISGGYATSYFGGRASPFSK